MSITNQGENMSPQDTASTSTPPKGNITFLLCGLAISQLHEDEWKSVILDSTGAPNHSRGNNLRVTVLSIGKDDRISIDSILLPPFNNNKDRFLDFSCETNCESTSSPYKDHAAGDYHLDHIVDFAKYSTRPKSEVLIQRSNQVQITKARFPKGIGFTAMRDEMKIGKHFGVSVKCSSKTRLLVESYNNNGGAYSYKFEVPDEGRLVVILDNDCHNTIGANDMPYYYNDGGSHQGIIVHPPEDPSPGGKVACNARQVSYINGGKSLFDVT